MAITRIIFGCGYLGLRVGRLWRQSGDHTIAVSRYEQRGSEPTSAARAGMFTALGDVTKPKTLGWCKTQIPNLGGASVEAMLFAVGYDRTGNADIHTAFATGLQNVLEALPPSITRVIYISTTGVYGPAAGEWVDESTAPNPQREGGAASLAAEQALAGHSLGGRSAILRLGGLYGPGRVPHLEKLRAGEPLPVPEDGWLNLIHVDDAARIVVAADAWLARQPLAVTPHIFCVVDHEPVRRREYYAEAARRLGATRPQFEQPSADSPAAARAAVSRRVSNERLRTTIDFDFQYPTYREGLAAVLAADKSTS